MVKTRAILLVLLGVGACEGQVEPNDSKTNAAAADDPCRTHTLEELCASTTCPATPEAVPWDCGDGFPTMHYATTCGGTRVVRNFGFTGMTWIFDASDQLIGAESASDVSHDCADGSSEFSTVYGETCEATGAGDDLCD